MSNKNVSYNKNTPRAIYNLLYNRISETDVRKTLWFPRAQDPKSTPRPITPTSGKIRNYMANKFILTDENAKCGDVPWMRLPEMMLIVAEGYARADVTPKLPTPSIRSHTTATRSMSARPILARL